MPPSKVIFCGICGGVIKDDMCKTHKLEWIPFEEYQKRKRVRVGKYSGKSKTPYGKYEDR